MTRFQELIRQFNIELECRKYAKSTISTYTSCLGIFLKAMNGKQKPLPFEDIKIFLGAISNSNYHKQFTATIHHFYKLVLKQPLSLQEIPYPRQTHYLPEIFSVGEINMLVNSYINLKHRAVIQLFYSCGLRIGELTNIEMAHIKSDSLLLRIKGGKGFKDRDVPIPENTLELLKSYYMAEKNKPKKWLFEGQNNEQYSERSIQQVFWQGVKRIGINRAVKPHSLRHSRASHLHDAGVDIKDISDFLGHEQLKTTADFYLKLSKKTLSNRIINADLILANIIGYNNKLLTA